MQKPPTAVPVNPSGPPGPSGTPPCRQGAIAAAHAAYERALAALMRAADPAAARDALLADPKTDPAVARWLSAADPRGLHLGALLVAKLRFERLLRGDAALAEWFDAAPGAFTAEFARYHGEVGPEALFPGAEAAAFRRWLGERAEPK